MFMAFKLLFLSIPSMHCLLPMLLSRPTYNSLSLSISLGQKMANLEASPSFDLFFAPIGSLKAPTPAYTLTTSFHDWLTLLAYCTAYASTLKMGAVSSSKTLVNFY
jgi:hypothetical protein